MSNEEIIRTKAEYNKWLSELTSSEIELIREMMDEARELGYDKGFMDAHQLNS